MPLLNGFVIAPSYARSSGCGPNVSEGADGGVRQIAYLRAMSAMPLNGRAAGSVMKLIRVQIGVAQDESNANGLADDG